MSRPSSYLESLSNFLGYRDGYTYFDSLPHLTKLNADGKWITKYIGQGAVCNANLEATAGWYQALTIVAATCFILSIKGLSDIKTARWGCIFGIIGMSLAIMGTYFSKSVCGYGLWIMWIGLVPGAAIGTVLAKSVDMIQMPQLVGLLNALGGLASTVTAIGLFSDFNQRWGPNGLASPDSAEKNPATLLHWHPISEATKDWLIQSVALHSANIVGSITFFGSIIAACKLQGIINSKARILPVRLLFNVVFVLLMLTISVVSEVLGYGSLGGLACVLVVTCVAAVWGIQFVMAIGGADMPVVICVLNTGSGIAGVFAGFMVASKLLVITGTFVASSGVVLSLLMCKAMNRSLAGVLVGGFGEGAPAKDGAGPAEQLGEKKEIAVEELAAYFNDAKTIIIVPGYGMAAGKAQHDVAGLIKTLRERGINVRLAIHPVAGRLPGHMNVLLAEAGVPYQIVQDMDDINDDFSKTDLVLILGANDIVNCSAEDDPTSVIAGMPVLRVWHAKRTIVVKRGGGTGYAGVENPLFFKDNNYMYYGSASPAISKLHDKIKVLEPKDRPGSKDKSMEMNEVKVEIKKIFAPLDNPKLKVGILKEDYEESECRVAMVPTVAAKLNELGYQVFVERGAGEKASFADQEYIDAGALVCDRESAIQQAAFINTVMPTKELIDCSDSLRDKYVICWVGKRTPDGEVIVRKCAEAGINLIDVTSVPRITIAQKLDVLSSQAKCAGVRATIEAAALFQRFWAQEITAAGKNPPAKVFVLGAGVAGLAAMGQARAFGADVRAWDVRDVSDQVISMGGAWVTVDFKEEGAGVGGYAKESSEAFAQAQKETFHKVAKDCDIIITTAAIPGRRSPLLIEDYMVRDMKPGSVIIDLAAVGGGNCALTKKGETFVTENHVIVCGRTDFPSKMASQASTMYAQNMFNLYQHIATSKDKNGSAGDVLPVIVDVMDQKFDEVVTDQIMCTYKGVVRTPPPPPMPSAPQPKTEAAAPVVIKKVSVGGNSFWLTTQGMLVMLLYLATGLVFINHANLTELVLVFILSAWIGYMLVVDVAPSLHTPLMSVSNAISGQVILGGIMMVSAVSTDNGDGIDVTRGQIAMTVLGCFAVFIASINIFGGFVITYQMLEMIMPKKDSALAQ